MGTPNTGPNSTSTATATSTARNSPPSAAGSASLSRSVGNLNEVSSRDVPAALGARDPPVQVADDPVKRRQMDALDDAHVVERDVQALLGDLLQLATGVAGAAEGREVVRVRPLDGP